MEQLKNRLQWLMGLRVAAVTLFLGLSISLEMESGERVLTFSVLIVGTYSLTIAYALALTRLWTLEALTGLAYFQLVMDLVLETFLVARTGGVESPFSVFYAITVTLASLTLGRRAGLITSSLSVLFIGMVANIQFYGLIGSWMPRSRLALPETIETLVAHVLALIAVGVLSGHLAEQLRKKDQAIVEKERGFNRLQAFHENVLECLSSGVFTTDSAGLITSFNRAAQEITGQPLEQVRQRPWWDVFTWKQADLFGADPTTLSLPHRFETEGEKTDGSRLVLGMTLSPLTELGERTGLVGVFQDLTPIRAMEEEIQRREWLALIGEMSAGMAHEIRNPLAALAGSMQMLKKDLSLDDTNQRLMDIAIRETARLDNTITEFLLYARPRELNLKECDLNTVLTDTMDLIRHECASRVGLSVTAHLGTGPMVVQVDQDQMKQVFWNLATNAFEAMPEGGRLTIYTRRRRLAVWAQIGEIVEIGFEDTGTGIKKEDIDKIFLPFFTTKKEGSGLGLATVHRIVDLHLGWVRVESREGKGSRFVVCLPMSGQEDLRLWQEGKHAWKKS